MRVYLLRERFAIKFLSIKSVGATKSIKFSSTGDPENKILLGRILLN